MNPEIEVVKDPDAPCCEDEQCCPQAEESACC
jgi:hypothetical protein